jgi:hypothetical protein
MLWLVNDFIEFGCYDMLCHVIFLEQECNSVRFQFKRNDSVFIKTICSFKSVQVRPNHGMDSIHETMLNPSRLIRLIGLLLVRLFDELDSDYNCCSVRFKICKTNWSNPVIIHLIGTILIKVNRSCFPTVQ